MTRFWGHLASVFSEAMPLPMDTRLGAYAILAPLGAGGMGEVYRARDTKLGRDVAIKVLPDELTQHREKLARFEREAKLLAALSHPHIATLYGVEEVDGRPLLIMELVEGETLAERIARGRIPPEEAFRIAVQVAEALEAAHEKGVIHRDLKPANVKVDADGNVKVLDFGLAKALEDEAPESELSQSPTLSRDATRTGVILGTAGYMSPEQAKGKAIDRRTDVFSFGVVLYEMLTGKKAYSGEDVSDVLAAVIKSDPDWSMLPASLPPPVMKLLRRCLAKDRKQRLQSVGDARLELHDILDAPYGSMPSRRSSPPWSERVAWIAAGGLLVGAIAFLLRPPVEDGSPVRFTYVLPEETRLTNTGRRPVALSPDGATLAYTANSRIYVRDLAQFEALPLEGTDAARDLAFSPDGQWIAFWNRGGLKKVAVSGGAPLSLCAANNPYGVSWDTAGTIYYGQGPDGIFRVSADGGDPERIVEPDPGEQAGHPQLLPSKDTLLFSRRGGAAGEGVLMAKTLETGEQREIFRGGYDARYLESGHLVITVGDNLQVMAFDLGRMEVAGEPITLAEGVQRGVGANYSVSDTGSLAYVPDRGDNELFWTDRQGERTPVGLPAGDYIGPRISPDGSRVALTSKGDIWIYDVARGTMDRITFTGNNLNPVWTAGGERIVFASGSGNHRILSKRADGTGDTQSHTPAELDSHAMTVSPDGSVLAFQAFSESADIWTLSLEGESEPQVFLRTEFIEVASSFSPDGRWLAFSSTQSGQFEVYVTPFPGPGPRARVSTSGGAGAMWSPDGSEIFYVEDDSIMAVDVNWGPEPSFGSPTRLFTVSLAGNPEFFPSYVPTPDGSGFFIAESAGGGLDRIHVVLDWLAEVERPRAP